ncbi:hypothetical protein NDU88_005190 [Pleurodeles waltl]|uniref:Uncharacterized protein n=1 Tax=Pleurodeles waltl TaxID=8319 RepID=A0AAV7RKB6_PLEWA|nr:hypothetical protein NDU88_005190 [Pleurodeles waltl]
MTWGRNQSDVPDGRDAETRKRNLEWKKRRRLVVERRATRKKRRVASLGSRDLNEGEKKMRRRQAENRTPQRPGRRS